MKLGNLYVNIGELLESNINRSFIVYFNNLVEERVK